MTTKRRIMIVSADRAEYGLQEPIMAELKRIETIEAVWCLPDSQAIPEDNLAKFRYEAGEFMPDIVVVPTDRTEMAYIATFAFHNGYVVAHFHAGNNSTNHPDDINRRVISCFSHILFANMLEHKQNLIKEGEEDWRIHVVGSTAFDNVIIDNTIMPQKSFDLVILHPNPQSVEETKHDLGATIATISNSKCVVWIYPNHDKNYEIIEEYLDNLPFSETTIKYQNLPRNQYLSLLKNCSNAIGNSSSFYYEMPVLDKREKMIQIGSRNKGLIVSETTTGGSKRIAKILANIELTDKLREKWKKQRLKNWIPPRIEHNKLTAWNWMVCHPENFKLGKNTDIGAFCYLQAEEGIEIEDNVEVAGGCKIYSVSTIDNKRGKVIIRKGAKIGANSVIMPCVTVGKNSIIGAFSFVNKDIPDNVVAVGIPAKVVREVNYPSLSEGDFLVKKLKRKEITGFKEE